MGVTVRPRDGPQDLVCCVRVETGGTAPEEMRAPGMRPGALGLLPVRVGAAVSSLSDLRSCPDTTVWTAISVYLHVAWSSVLSDPCTARTLSRTLSLGHLQIVSLKQLHAGHLLRTSQHRKMGVITSVKGWGQWQNDRAYAINCAMKNRVQTQSFESFPNQGKGENLEIGKRLKNKHALGFQLEEDETVMIKKSRSVEKKRCSLRKFH